MTRLCMPLLLFVSLLIYSAAGNINTANAEVRIAVKTRHYSIYGQSGYQIAKSMLRKGPYSWKLRQRVWAITEGKIDYSLNAKRTKGSCRVSNPSVTMKITYTMPKLRTKLDRASGKTWRRMFRLLTVHEQFHGKIYSQLARNVHAALRKMRSQKDCKTLRKKAGFLVDKYRNYARERNRKFDQRDVRSYRKMERLTRKSAGSS